MKRLYIVLTFVLSSFLLLSGRKVKAYEYTADLSLINEDFFTIKENAEKLLEEDTTHSDYYFILRANSSYYVYVPDNFTEPYSCIYSGETELTFNPKPRFYRIDAVRPNFSLSFPSYTGNFYLYAYKSSFIYLYSNFVFPVGNCSTESLTIKYGDREKVVNNGNNLPSLYDLYLEINNPDPEEPEPVDNTPILTDFYTTVIEKINYLCEVIVSNYIYLSIFVIILIIILFELIFRRYL